MSFFRKLISFIREPAFKVEKCFDEEKKLYYFNVHVKGKCSSPVPKDPIDLLGESRGKNCFSAKDYDLIIQAMLDNQKHIIENKYKNQFSLIKHQFSEQLEVPLVVYKDQREEEIHIKPAKEIYLNTERLKKFEPTDIACIGYIVGSHDAEQEFNQRRVKNQKTNIVKLPMERCKNCKI